MRLPGDPRPSRPALELDNESEEELMEELTNPPVMPKKKPQSKKRGKKKRSRTKDEVPWAVANWHWLVAVAILLCAPLGQTGMKIAMLGVVGGVIATVIGFIISLGKFMLEDPGAALTMMISPRARVRMSYESDDNPYKKRTRRAVGALGGLAWRCLIIVLASMLSLALGMRLR